MSGEEFTEYLTSIGGLNRCWALHKGLILDPNFFEIHEGWYEMVKTLIDELISLGWNKKLYQVKEKFGGLRFYGEDIPEGGDELIASYETLSYNICENCGNAGVLRKGGWHRTLCDEHSEGKEPMDK